ncbi:MAG: phosphatidylglycerophosphatase A [Gammaproteobacteria bacterium]
MKPDFPALLKRPSALLAFGFGSGLSPKAPGTVGTVAAVPFWLLLAQLNVTGQLMVIALAFVFGVWICDRTGKWLGVHDHGGIVWDEFVGLWITLIAVPLTWQTLLLGFVLFRFFDIIKPWPIGWLDKRMQGGLGVMVDDVVAGLFGLALIHAGLAYWPGFAALLGLG